MTEVEGADGGPEAGWESKASRRAAEPSSGKWGQVSRPDTALNRILYGARSPDVPGIHRVLAAELLIVLAVFPLPFVITAVSVLIARIQLGYSLPSGSLIPIHGEWLSAGLQVGGELTELAGAALVWYLLTRSGEGLGAIGLGGRKLRMDLALILPVFIVVQYVPQTFASDVLRWLDLQPFYLSNPLLINSPAAITTIQVVSAVMAGIVEEIVVLGFLVRRLEQLGLRTSWVVVIAVLVRVSYHLYEGWYAVPIALWALATVLVYLRIRRLLPFILCHIAWDVAIPVGFYYATAYHVILVTAIVTTAVLTLQWGRRPEGIMAP
jgi:hypothetical protein